MDISLIPNILKAVQLSCKDAVLMRGLHGIGKSKIVENFADENDMYCETVFVSLMDESDLQGMPYIEDNITRFAEPVFITRLKRASESGKKTILFLDELNRGSKYIRAAVMSLILNRRVNEHSLPPDVLIVSAINPVDNDGYEVGELDIALVDRFLLVDVEVNTKSWLKWAVKNNVNFIVTEFISLNPNLIHYMPDKDGIGGTPRSWEVIGSYVDVIDYIDENVQLSIIKGKLGNTVGIQFYKFMKTFNSRIKIEDIEGVLQDENVTADSIIDISKTLYSSVLSKLEHIQQHNLINQMWRKYIPSAVNTKDIKVLLVALYAINLETRASILKYYKNNYLQEFVKLVNLDFDKGLVRSINL